LAKRLSEKQKKDLCSSFIDGKSINSLAEIYKCTRLTIIRNLKKVLGESKYKEISDKKNSQNDITIKENINNQLIKREQIDNNEQFSKNNLNGEQSDSFDSFIEIMPLEHDFENEPQKDISSVPLSKINFPSTVFLIVKKEIELETKYLKDYPEWQFLPKDDLDRKTIEIHYDLKTAKRLCSKDQKVIKVPNTDVFRVVSPILLSRGITRIVTDDNLICL